MSDEGRTYQTAIDRWAGIGPYYAMFPTAFADAVVRSHTSIGDTVLDPFAGRGTSVFSAATQGRRAIGIELNPVGWVYAKAKLAPASRDAVENRIVEISETAGRHGLNAVALPEFFRHCYTVRVRQFLCAARAELDWRHDTVDRTLMALLLVHLHGKRDASLSNQMRQAKAMAPDYAVNWWRRRRMKPPEVDPVAFLKKRLDWRYAKGRPHVSGIKVYLGDSVKRLPEVQRRLQEGRINRPKLLLTSPPYYGVTNYHYDQWLRLWLLGGRSDARRDTRGSPHASKFEHFEKYKRLLARVFSAAAEIMSRNSIIYVRTSRREETYEATKAALKDAFPRKRMHVTTRPFLGPTQTHLFGDESPKKGEADVVLRPM